MKAILREAETRDMKSIIILIEKLINYEVSISNISIIDDIEKRKDIIIEIIARSLIDTNKKVWVVDKSRRILGVFIVEKREYLTIEKNNPVCIFTHAYSQKTVLSFFEIHNKVKEWASNKGCNSIRMSALIRNTQIQKLVEKLGYNKQAIIYEMEI